MDDSDASDGGSAADSDTEVFLSVPKSKTVDDWDDLVQQGRLNDEIDSDFSRLASCRISPAQSWQTSQSISAGSDNVDAIERGSSQANVKATSASEIKAPISYTGYTRTKPSVITSSSFDSSQSYSKKSGRQGPMWSSADVAVNVQHAAPTLTPVSLTSPVPSQSSPVIHKLLKDDESTKRRTKQKDATSLFIQQSNTSSPPRFDSEMPADIGVPVFGEGVFLSDQELVALLRLPPKQTPTLRTKSSFQDFFRGIRSTRMRNLLVEAYSELESASEQEEKVSKRMELLRSVLT